MHCKGDCLNRHDPGRDCAPAQAAGREGGGRQVATGHSAPRRFAGLPSGSSQPRAAPGGGAEQESAGVDLLYDIYGGLLTRTQQRIFRLRHHLDLSLAEIAEQEGVSRQAVYDVLQRGERSLREVERRLGLARRYLEQRRLVDQARQHVQALSRLESCRSSAELRRGLRRLQRALAALRRRL